MEKPTCPNPNCPNAPGARDAEVKALVAALRDVLDQSSPTAMFNSHLHKIARTALADWESAELAELGRGV